MSIVPRGIGVTDLLHSAATWPLVVLFAVITQLGDAWFFVLLTGTLYVANAYVFRGLDRRRAMFLCALVLTYLAVINGLKGVFKLPRPPGAGTPPTLGWIPPVLEGAFTNVTTAEGTGFPSGHALGSTMIWGGLALMIDRGRVRIRLAIAGTIIGLVSLSRLILGVHYLVDVAVGVVIGGLILGILYRLTNGGTDPERALVVSILLGGAGLLMGITFDSVAVFGSTVGGWVAWRHVRDELVNHQLTRGEVVRGVVVVGGAAGLFGIVYLQQWAYPFTFLGAAVLTGVVVATPVLGERVSRAI